MEKIIISIIFATFLIAAITPRIIQKRKKLETVGCIGINKPLFFIGKISLFSSYLFILIQLFFVNLSLFAQNKIFIWLCVVFMGIGVLLFTLAISSLGTFSLRVGLAQEKTALRTTGIYRLTRNPMLLGLYYIAIGSAIYVQNPVNWVLILIAVTIHHKIILAEEKFLHGRFGEAWTEYTNKVHRYL
jgi:protein-S-isoprenylcysteine O-methyltransferase Ste14